MNELVLAGLLGGIGGLTRGVIGLNPSPAIIVVKMSEIFDF